LSKAVEYTGQSKLLLMGDFNYPDIDNENYSVNAGEDSAPFRFFTMTQDLFLLQHETENTRMRLRNSPSLIDLIFTNEDNLIKKMNYEAPVGKCNHVSLTFTSMTCIAQDKTDSSKLNYWKGNYGEIKNELSKTVWSSLLQENDIEGGWSEVKNLLLHLSTKYIPVLHKNEKWKKNDWMNEKTSKQLQARDKAWKKYRRY
jgi:Endonuclease-reverse transcriptase